MAYVPPHRRAAARLGRLDENSTVVSPTSQAGSNCCGTSTVVSTTPTEPGLIYHDGVPPDRVVDLSHLRAEPEDDISPDDSVSVAGERWGWHQRQPASGGGGGGGGGSSHVALGDVRGGSRALDLRSGVTGVSGGLVGGGGGAQQPLPLASLSEHQVAALLRGIGLGKYAEACLRVPLRGRDLLLCMD